MLDRVSGSATLSYPFSIGARAASTPPSPGGGHYARCRAQTTYPPQSSHSAAISVDRGGFGQERPFHGSAQYFTGRVLLRLVGAVAGGDAYRGDHPHTGGSHR